MNAHPEKGTRVSHTHSSPRKSLLRRSGVAGLAHSGAFHGSSAPSHRFGFGGKTSGLGTLGLLIILAALFLVLSVGSAQAKLTRPFDHQITGTPTGAGGANVPFAKPWALAVDPSDNLWLTDTEQGVVNKFDPSGAFLTQSSGAGHFSGFIRGLAFSAAANSGAGRLFVADSNADDLWGLEPDGTFATEIDPGLGGCCVIQDAADNTSGGEGSGDLYIASRLGTGKVLRIDTTGAAKAFSDSGQPGKEYISGNELTGSPTQAFSEPSAVAVDTAGRVYVADRGLNAIFEYEPSGEFIREVVEPGGTALGEFDALAVDPVNGNVLLSEGNNAAVATIVEFTSTGTFLSRITNAGGTALGEVRGLAFDSTGHLYVADASSKVVDVFAPLANLPIETDGGSVSAVTATTATLGAQIDPQGVPTSYSFQFGTAPCSAAACTELPAPPTPIGSGEAFVAVNRSLTGLSPNTTYFYRLIVVNGETHQTIPGPDRNFTTQSAGSLLLPDDRGWELVSPPDKHGGLIEPLLEHGVIKAAADGGAISYIANAPIEADPQGNSGTAVQALSLRGAGGWSSCNIASPHQGVTGNGEAEYRFFAADLSSAVIQPFGLLNPELSPDATEQTPYLRTLGSCGPSASPYSPLVTAANAPPPFGEEGPCTDIGQETVLSSVCGPRFVDATNDLGHLVLSSAAPLTLGAGRNQLYEWSGGTLQQVSLLAPNGAGEELPAPEDEEHAARLGYKFTRLGGSARRAISDDGSRVFWGAERSLYLRDTTLHKTLQLDLAEEACGGGCESGGGVFQIASADGARVFFTDNKPLTEGSGASELPQRSDLYECRIGASAGRPTCDLTDLTPEIGGEPADVHANILGAGEDGEELYFVATGTLGTAANVRGESAVAGQPNLYVRKGAETSFIATLSPADSSDWIKPPEEQPTRVSPSGRYLAFMSARPLTGYDNRDALSGKPDAEVFLYDADSGRIVCASCDPTGARPVGIEYERLESKVVEQRLATVRGEWTPPSGWVAALLPQATSSGEPEGSLYQSRYLSDSGRLFFNVLGPLVPQDSNGIGDVYQFEFPQGPGQPASNTCTTASSTYSTASGGCVDLISSGTSKESSGFLDASESGDDVFFLTGARLTPKDVDAAGDIYDARVGGGEPQVVNPPACEGDACQAPAVPPNHPTPGTALVNGPGNVLQCPKGKVKQKGKCVKQKSKKRKKHPKKKGHQKQKRANSKHGGHK